MKTRKKSSPLPVSRPRQHLAGPSRSPITAPPTKTRKKSLPLPVSSPLATPNLASPK
ncbi:uncharacterized protein BCR38DRAFT_448031 [Pseudomassariella vexata]|uniref:Uncharacterized protein n=1 Tax=Pseudomassariella vexata TaxID=1141098 RepID=A0A1Y2DFP5_9PEZI|nr:uncharacterized protein BCR38DRAFT_448031 [Pseudomassariella vexata]ORY58102.1 hypothetical protein BCR38DRAFT_448031 [Pseudomassariella vexata]